MGFIVRLITVVLTSFLVVSSLVLLFIFKNPAKDYGQLIIIHGPSSCGKSSTAKEVQNLLAEKGVPYMLIQTDGLSSMLPKQWLNLDPQDSDFQNSKSKNGLQFVPGKDGNLSIEIGSVYRRMQDGIGPMVVGLLKTGNNVILEGSLLVGNARDLFEYLCQYKPLVIHVACPVEVAEQREVERKGIKGLARYQNNLPSVYPSNLNIDTSKITSKEAAATILQYISEV